MGKHWHKADVRKLGRCLCQLCTFRGNALPSAGSGHEEESNTSPTSTHSKHSMKGVCVGVRFSLRGKHHHHHHGQSTFLHPSCWESSLAGLWFDCVHLHTMITSAVKRLVVINHILNKSFSLHYMWPWSTEAVISSTGIFVARLQYIVWLKIIHFYYMPNH